MPATSLRSHACQTLPLACALFASACALPDDTVTTTMTDDEIRVASHARTCDDPSAEVQCHARVLVDAFGAVIPNATPAGLGPTQLRSAYKLTSSGSSAITIAIVDAFGYPNAESDLATYRSTFGLPPCTTANGCFRKVNQSGGTTFPPTDVGWDQEQALDLDMASAICPNCKILLVQATSATFSNLAAAVNRAATMGAHAISNSYGGGESGSTGVESAYNHAGIAVTASSGDGGFGVEFPASSPHVTAVGGTSLRTASNTRGWTETVWSGAGSGCSTVYAKPSWQHDTGCSRRTIADVSAVADPNTGVAVFGPNGSGSSAFLVFGGTSVAAPIIAGVYALNGGTVNFGADPYAHTSALFDGPTGLGTPNGTAAF
ncbi:MAG: peptidase S8 [Deltaproteobacteria bacterium]|nr:MAG: peptidase S8 [Deltaproteobacteria bacterium]